jgi:hypothetical protein
MQSWLALLMLPMFFMPFDYRIRGGGEGSSPRGLFAHLPRQRRNRDPRAFTLKYVAEVFKVRVAAADYRVAQLEGGDVGARVDLVGGVH